MCYHFSLKSAKRAIELKFKTSPIADEIYFPSHHINGFDTPSILGIVEPGIVTAMQWGLVPTFAKNKVEAHQLALKTLNAKCETVFDKKSFSEAIQDRRCLILADAFYEWQTIGNKKVPYKIQLRYKQVFAFAGIYEPVKDALIHKEKLSCSILTTAAQGIVRQIHHTKMRMPIILPEALASAYLSASLSRPQLEELFKQAQFEELEVLAINAQWEEIEGQPGFQTQMF
jgi:putative SOS response-associated peptidase YedK